MPADTPNPAVTAYERLIAWTLALLVVPLVSLLFGGPHLLDRPFWSDEALSWLISSDPDLAHANAALAGAVDTNAPLIHWYDRLIGNLFGHTPWVYRCASLPFLSIALVGLYQALRASFRIGPAIIGCLAFWALPIVIAHQTETRFYGPLLAGSIWTCTFVGRRRSHTDVASAVGLSLSAIVMCGSHYFGALALAGVVGIEWLRAPKRSIGALLPTFAGFATTLCMWPLLRTQREAVADVGGTWIPDAFWANLATCGQMLLPASILFAFLTIAIAAVVLGGRRRVAQSIAFAMRSPLTGLALLVLTMIAFDRLVQPVLVPRYLMPALPVVALLVAALAAGLPRRVMTVAGLCLLGLVAGELLRIRTALDQPHDRTAMSVLRSVEQVPRDVPILSDWRGHLIPIWAARPELRPQLGFVSDPDIVCPDLQQAIPFEWKLVGSLQAFYDFPAIRPLREAEQCGHFILVTEFPERVEARFSGWEKRQLGPLTFELRNPHVADAR